MIPGSGSVIICTDPDLDPAPVPSVKKQKNLDKHGLLNDLLSLKTDVNLPTGSNKPRKNFVSIK